RFDRVLDQVVAYYQGQDVLLMSNYRLTGRGGSTTVGHMLFTGRIDPNPGAFVGGNESEMGYRAMLTQVHDAEGPRWRSQDKRKRARPKYGILGDKYVGTSLWHYGAITFVWNK